MLKNKLASAIVLSSLLVSVLPSTVIAQEKEEIVVTSPGGKKSVTVEDNSTQSSNQMMILFMERLKSGNVKEARDTAKAMIRDVDLYEDSKNTDYKTFYSEMEKELYVMKNQKDLVGKKLEWLEKPFADGYYFLSVLDFQEKKYSSALENMSKCIYWNPVHSPYYCERGFMLLNAGEQTNVLDALIAYEKALELADNEEDFAAALRGLAFVNVSRGRFDVAMACLVLSKEYDNERPDADEEILEIKSVVPVFTDDFTAKEARQILKENGIQTTYSQEHSKVLVSIASTLTKPEEKEDAMMLLERALYLDPTNTEAAKKMKSFQ